ncbi:MAG: hypothetical protein ACREIC_06415, partial [Limisphaerales bacterium]
MRLALLASTVDAAAGTSRSHSSGYFRRAMNRRRLWMTGVAVGLLLVVAALAFRATGAGGSKVSVSFVNFEHSFGEGPVTVECERLAFAVRNLGARSAFLDVPDLTDEDGTRVQMPHVLGPVKAHQTTQLYLYLPKGSRPR